MTRILAVLFILGVLFWASAADAGTSLGRTGTEYREGKLNGAPAPRVSTSAAFTYGSYDYGSEKKIKASLHYTPNKAGGLTLNIGRVDLDTSTIGDINQTQFGVSAYKTFGLGKAGYMGSRADVQYLDSDDTNSDGTTIPYLSLIYQSSGQGLYLDAGYAYSGYKYAKVSQFTLTGGVGLFGGRVWSNTRAYYIHLTKEVQGEKTTFAVEERLTFYAIPQKLTITLYGLTGERIYAYDPDSFTVYNLADVQKGSVGATMTFYLTPAASIFADVTREAYENNYVNDSYGINYFTVGLTFIF